MKRFALLVVLSLLAVAGCDTRQSTDYYRCGTCPDAKPDSPANADADAADGGDARDAGTDAD